MNTRSPLWTVRSSYLTQAKHQNDLFLNLGYNYHGKMLKNGTSDELWANPLQVGMYAKIEGMITYILETAKNIKKSMSFAHDWNTLNIN